MRVKALVNMEYPASRQVRERIRRGEALPFDQRGEIMEVRQGTVLDAPSDLVNGWLENGYVERCDGQEV